MLPTVIKNKNKRQLEHRVSLSTNRVIRLTVERFPNEGKARIKSILSQRGLAVEAFQNIP
jgi:hypothetical protein